MSSSGASRRSIRPSAFFSSSGGEPDPTSPTHVIGDDEIQLDFPQIAEGAYGRVYRGHCRGLLVAVKIPFMPRKAKSALVVSKFLDEIQIMSKVVHPNVVMLLGAYIPVRPSKEHQLKLVMEYFPGGSIEGILYDTSKPLSLFKRMQWASQLSSGLHWLHCCSIIHQDVKPANILYDGETDRVKICDFGLSVYHELKLGSRSSGAVGTPLFSAPELALQNVTSQKVDVWSYGITLWCIFSRKKPYAELEQNWRGSHRDFYSKIAQGTRPWTEERWKSAPPPSLERLMISCCNVDVSERPAMIDVCSSFEEILLESAIPSSVAGQNFWMEKFLLYGGMPTQVGYFLFQRHFNAAFQHDNAGKLEDAINKNILQQFFSVNGCVTVDHFGLVCSYLPPLNPTNWFQSVTDLCEAPWFWGLLSSSVCAQKFVAAQPGSFLVRFSSQPGMYALTFRKKNQVHSRHIIHEDSKWYLNTGDVLAAGLRFDSLHALVGAIQRKFHWVPLDDSSRPFAQLFSSGESAGVVVDGYGLEYEVEVEPPEPDEEQVKEGEQEARETTLVTLDVDSLEVFDRITLYNRIGTIRDQRSGWILVEWEDSSAEQWLSVEGIQAKAKLIQSAPPHG